MWNIHYGKITAQDAMGALNRCARYAGFGFCVAWGFLLFAVPEFQPSSGLNVFLWSMAPGCLVCLFVIAISRWRAISPSRSGAAFCCAALASIGSFLHASPIASSQAVQYAGLVLAGASFIGLLLPWFVAYAELSAREVFLSSGLALVVGSVTCVIASACDCEIAGFVLSILPVVSLLLLPVEKTSDRFRGDSVAGVDCSLFQVIKAAIPTKTLAGLLLVYFVIDALRGIGRLPGSFLGRADVSFLIIPLLVSLGCVLVSAIRRKIDLEVACKLLLAVFFDFACFVGCCGASGVSLWVRNERMHAGALLDAVGVHREEKPGFRPGRLCYGDDCRIRGWIACWLGYACNRASWYACTVGSGVGHCVCDGICVFGRISCD